MRMTLSLRKKYKTMKTIIGSMLACLSVSVSAQTVKKPQVCYRLERTLYRFIRLLSTKAQAL